MSEHDLECECLVVGSGPGGAVTASMLAEAGRDVWVIEEGWDESGKYLPYSLDEMNGLYRHGGVSVSWGNPHISYLEGCCLGGASEINAGLYHRPPSFLLDQWAKEYKIESFSAMALEPFLEMNEKDLEIETMPSALGPGSRIIERGAKALNWKSIELLRTWDYSHGDSQGQRRSMSRSFIPRAKQAGAKFILGTKVRKIEFRGDKAYEALCVAEKKINTRVRFKHAFVCGGAIQTPFLLRRSGLTTNIGERLRMHLSVRLIALFEEVANSLLEGVPVMQVSEFKPHLTLGGSYSGTAYLALWLAGRHDFAQLMQSSEHLGLFYANIIAKALGRVRIEHLSGEAMLSINIKNDDLISLADAIYKMGQLLFAAGAKKVYSPVPGGKDFDTLASMESLGNGSGIRAVDLSTMHLFSSCPMGENLSLCALDSFGRVHGKSNLYVNDASMLPDAPGTNPQALIMALARRNVMHWLEYQYK